RNVEGARGNRAQGQISSPTQSGGARLSGGAPGSADLGGGDLRRAHSPIICSGRCRMLVSPMVANHSGASGSVIDAALTCTAGVAGWMHQARSLVIGSCCGSPPAAVLVAAGTIA